MEEEEMANGHVVKRGVMKGQILNGYVIKGIWWRGRGMW
jgi:hypothetical protein